MHIYNKTHVLIITISVTWFGTYFAIFRENFFICAQNYCSICDFISLQLINSYLKNQACFNVDLVKVLV